MADGLRLRLQQIWNDHVVRCPAHQVWWHDGGEDVKARSTTREDEGLCWSKGKKYPQPSREQDR